MTSYALGICDICEVPMTLQEISEGVLWEQQDKHWLTGDYWFFEPEETIRVAHKRCWKALSETKRKNIRREADEEPKSMGQRV